MTATQDELDAYRAYLADTYGLPEDTLDAYVGVMRRAFEAGGPVARLRATDLSPKSKRVVRAAARHWAAWKDDAKLRRSLDQIRLPPARRKKAKVPLTRDQLFAVMDEIDRDKRLAAPVRAVLGLMACRGFRDGDVLRMRRAEIARALDHGRLAYVAKGRRTLEFKVIRTYRRWLEVLMTEGGSRWSTVDELVAPRSKSAKARSEAAARKIQRALARIGRRLEIEGLHPHQLRRTYAVEYLRAHKGDPEAILKLQQHMQWASASTAMEYVDHIRGEELDTVAESLFDR